MKRSLILICSLLLAGSAFAQGTISPDLLAMTASAPVSVGSLAGSASTAASTGSVANSASASAGLKTTSSPTTVTVLVQFSSVPTTALASSLGSSGAVLQKQFKHFPKVQVLTVPVAMVPIIAKLPGVKYVSPDRPVVRHLAAGWFLPVGAAGNRWRCPR